MDDNTRNKVMIFVVNQIDTKGHKESKNDPTYGVMDNSKNKVLKEMLAIDIYATNVYTLGYEKDSWSNLDYTHNMIIF